jgi:sulfoxide reductase heme-binding subunit YedZ
MNAPCSFWLILATPAAILTFRYWQQTVFYGEYLHFTGELAAELLIITLAITPLRLAFPGARWVRWLMARRRYLGVATFAYSLLHALAYLVRKASLQAIVDDALTLAIGTGWIALALLLLLAATSNDASVRILQHKWKLLHRAVYFAAALTFAHWILTAFDPLAGALHLGVLATLLAYRVWKKRKPRRIGVEPNI